jgi:hypothetical protein
MEYVRMAKSRRVPNCKSLNHMLLLLVVGHHSLPIVTNPLLKFLPPAFPLSLTFATLVPVSTCRWLVACNLRSTAIITAGSYWQL